MARLISHCMHVAYKLHSNCVLIAPRLREEKNRGKYFIEIIEESPHPLPDLPLHTIYVCWYVEVRKGIGWGESRVMFVCKRERGGGGGVDLKFNFKLNFRSIKEGGLLIFY